MHAKTAWEWKDACGAHTHTHLCLLCCILSRPLLLGQGLAPLGLCSRLSLWQQRQTRQYSVSKDRWAITLQSHYNLPCRPLHSLCFLSYPDFFHLESFKRLDLIHIYATAPSLTF